MSLSATKDELTTLYDQWMTAIQQLDFETLDRIIGPEYTYAATNQGRKTRQQWWDTVPAYEIKSFELKVDRRPRIRSRGSRCLQIRPGGRCAGRTAKR